MNCEHANRIPDPDYRHQADSFTVCVDCGVCLVRCHYCPAVYPDVDCYGSPGFCAWGDGCEACCTQTEGPLTPADAVRVIEAACDFVENHWRWKTPRALPPSDRLAWIKREFHNGGRYGAPLTFDGFVQHKTKGRGLWAIVHHRSGVITWQQILNFIEASTLVQAVCITCGGITEKIASHVDAMKHGAALIAQCRWCYATGTLTLDPEPDLHLYGYERAPLQVDTPKASPQLSLFG